MFPKRYFPSRYFAARYWPFLSAVIKLFRARSTKQEYTERLPQELIEKIPDINAERVHYEPAERGPEIQQARQGAQETKRGKKTASSRPTQTYSRRR